MDLTYIIITIQMLINIYLFYRMSILSKKKGIPGPPGPKGDRGDTGMIGKDGKDCQCKCK